MENEFKINMKKLDKTIKKVLSAVSDWCGKRAQNTGSSYLQVKFKIQPITAHNDRDTGFSR
jgi:hypothetical protein